MTALVHAPLEHRSTRFAAVSATALARTYAHGAGAVQALRGVSLEVSKGEFTAVMGPAGSGKSTLMHLLGGLDTPDAGAVHIAGEDITRMPDADLTRVRRRHVGFLFASCNLLATLSVEDNLTMPLAIAGRTPEQAVVDRLLDRMGLTAHRDLKPAQLSDALKQRVALARALLSSPTVLFADEPTGDLDAAAGADLLARLRGAVDEDGQTTVMATRDARAAATADRVLFLAGGRVVADLQGPSEAAVLATVNDAARAYDDITAAS